MQVCQPECYHSPILENISSSNLNLVIRRYIRSDNDSELFSLKRALFNSLGHMAADAMVPKLSRVTNSQPEPQLMS